MAKGDWVLGVNRKTGEMNRKLQNLNRNAKGD